MLWRSVYNAAARRCLFLYIATQNGVIPCNRDGCRIWFLRSMVLGAGPLKSLQDTDARTAYG